LHRSATFRRCAFRHWPRLKEWRNRYQKRHVSNNRIFRRGRGKRNGATAVEMALVAPFIFLIVFASIEFSRVVMIKQSLTNASREGCRVATLATTQDAADVDQAVRQYVQRCFAQYDDPDIVAVTITPSSLGSVASGTEITVQVEVQFSDVSWVPSKWANSLTLVGTSTMKRE
jgi:Flp pilus assembly protein TadG